MVDLDEPWADERTSRMWIHGDLHPENFGTYVNSHGELVFDVNDYDEAYVGPFTWDLRRFVAGLAIMGWRKALPEQAVRDLRPPTCAATSSSSRSLSTAPTTPSSRCGWATPSARSTRRSSGPAATAAPRCSTR